MRAKILAIAALVAMFSACGTGRIKDLHFDGEFTAKQIVGVKYTIPPGYTETRIDWYLGETGKGPWERLPGISGNEIVLLVSYAGKYLRCEVTNSKGLSGDVLRTEVVSPVKVEFRDNQATDWFHDAGFGIMVHYLKPIFAPDGGSKEWNDAVNSFDTEKFASEAASAGAGFVMFTLGQNSGDYCSPNAAYDSVMGIQPGDLCSLRDLPMDLIRSLEKYNIPLILYLPSNPPVGNRLVSEKFRYPFGKDSATSQYNQPILEKMIREWSLRYGKSVKGWWFDGLYEWNNIRSTRMDMSQHYNISTHTLAAKAGNKNSIVTYNYGFGRMRVNTPYCDYSSGEKPTIDEFPSSRWVEDGVQWFLFTYLGEKWGGKGLQFETDDLVEKARKIIEGGGVLCLEVVPDAKGNIQPLHLEQIRAVGKGLGKVKS